MRELAGQKGRRDQDLGRRSRRSRAEAADRALARGDRRRPQDSASRSPPTFSITTMRSSSPTPASTAFAHLVRDKVMSDALIALSSRTSVYVMPNIGSPERGIHTDAAALASTSPISRVFCATPWRAEVIARMRKAHSQPRSGAGRAQPRRTTTSSSAAWPSSTPPACASFSAATPGSRTISSAMPSRRSSSSWRRPA